MANTVVGVFDSYTQAQQALNDLLGSGFSREHIELAPEQDTGAARRAALHGEQQAERGRGGIIASLFRSLFSSAEMDRHADIYSEAVRRGSYLLTVHTDSDQQGERAIAIMHLYQPVDIDERIMQWQNQGWSQYDASAPALSETEIEQERNRYTGGTLEGKTSIPVIQEDIEIRKREVPHGGVRIFQRIVATPVNEAVQLREEHVSVERHPVNQVASEADLAALKEASFEVRENAEQLMVSKTARVVEEVVIDKTVSECTETVNDIVRRTEVEVEPLADGASAGAGDADFRRHWQSAYGQSGARYEDYAPAYQYGSSMGGEERYRSFRWSDVEPEVRRDWESNNAGHPWESFKDAIRYGWEKITR